MHVIILVHVQVCDGVTHRVAEDSARSRFLSSTTTLAAFHLLTPHTTMSGSVVVLEPLPAAGVKTCEPNLMPFHISYTGPALISTFMDVKPAKEQELGTPAQQESAAEGIKASTDEAKDAVGDGSVEDKKEEEAENADAPSMTVATTDGPVDTQASSSSNRTVSTFRGRVIQGLKVDLPEGYRGLVLQAPPAHATSSGPSSSTATAAQSFSKASSSNSKSKTASQEDAVDEDEYPTARSTRRRGRLARSAVSTKIVDVEKEEEEKKRKAMEAAIDVDQEEPVAMEIDETAGPESNSPQRRLKPVAQFSSFTIWHPDNPVVESQDEYYRSVHEWTALATVVCHTCIIHSDILIAEPFLNSCIRETMRRLEVSLDSERNTMLDF